MSYVSNLKIGDLVHIQERYLPGRCWGYSGFNGVVLTDLRQITIINNIAIIISVITTAIGAIIYYILLDNKLFFINAEKILPI